MQVAFLDVLHEQEVLGGRAGKVVGVKSVTEADAGEVAVGEHGRHLLPARLTHDDHFGSCDVFGVAIWLPWRQRVPRPRAAADRRQCHLVERGQAAMADGPAGFGPPGHGQDTWAAGIWWRPPLTGSRLNLGALPLHCRFAVRAGCHDAIVAATRTAPGTLPGPRQQRRCDAPRAVAGPCVGSSAYPALP